MADKTVTHSYQTASLFTRGRPIVRDGQTISADAGRTEILKNHTVMGFSVVNQEWVPFESSATDTTGYIAGILLSGDISAADIVAGNVEDVIIAVGGDPITIIREDELVFDNGSDTLDTLVGAGVTATTARENLKGVNIHAQNTISMNQEI